MCGIVGVVSNAPVNQATVEAMRDVLAHRGPDHAGLWLADDARVCLGHRRLAILDLMPEANQPFISRDGRFVITYNGEIYNFHELRRELIAQGVPFRTRSDTEVLVEAFRRWGEACLDHLSGMFAFAIWDAAERRLFCARDRVGEKPFYYALIGGDFVFASELKALLRWPGFRRDIHFPALVDYLCFGFIVDPKSIWEGCLKLPPGHWLAVEAQPDNPPLVTKPVMYWDLEFNPDWSIDDWGPVVRETLHAAAHEMAVADVAIGTFLSGGVDSASVTAALSRSDRSLRSFTIGFQEEGYDERSWAREVARLFGTRHTDSLVQSDDVAPVFDQLVWHFDEPFSDYSYLPTFYLCREARKVITVALSGDGGDELFAGYLKYQRLGMRQDLERYLPLARLLAPGARLLLPSMSRLHRMLDQYGAGAETALADMLMLGFTADGLQAAARGPLAETLKHYTPMDAVRPLISRAPPDEVGLINAMRYLDLKLTLAGDILVKIDRASMAVALEVRPVFLHREMIALATRIPPNRLAGRNHSKTVVKSAMQGWLPDSILYRKKQGFAMPLKRWLRSDLQQMWQVQPGEGPLAAILDPGLLNRMIRTHASGSADLTSLIHSLFFLHHWMIKWT